MSENKLPEGLKQDLRDYKKRLSETTSLDDYELTLCFDSAVNGAKLVLSYIAKQEPVGKIIDGFFLSNDEAIGLYDKKGKVITPLYIHPSHLEEENKRLREALERVKKHLDTMTFHNTTAPTDDEGYEIYWIHKDKYDNIISIANNALNK